MTVRIIVFLALERTALGRSLTGTKVVFEEGYHDFVDVQIHCAVVFNVHAKPHLFVLHVDRFDTSC